MSMLPTTPVKGRDSNDDNERKKNLQQQRDFITDLLKHYSTDALDMKYCKPKILLLFDKLNFSIY
jgi:hypothetical protein